MATLTALTTGMKTALTASLFTSEAILYSFDPMKCLSYQAADKWVAIQPRRLGVPTRTFPTTAARTNYIVSWEAMLWVFIRYNVDEYNRKDSYLLDQTYGSLQVVDSIVDCFQNYVAADGVNNYGYQLDDITWPDRTEEKDQIGWAVTKLSYHTDLTGK